MLPQKNNEGYTYADYCAWDDGKRWELIDGVAYAMSPAPYRKHQEVVGVLHYKLFDYLIGKPCKVFISPFDVRLNADEADDTVVQPDVLVVCDSSKLDEKGCVGAPDLAIEVLSPSSAKHDRIIKLHKYQQAGVRECWIVDPDAKAVQVFLLENGRYYVTGYVETDSVPVSVLPGCVVDLQEVF